MKKISRILVENALEKDEIRSIKGGSGPGPFNFDGCLTDIDCEPWEKCCTGVGGAIGRGVCQTFC